MAKLNDIFKSRTLIDKFALQDKYVNKILFVKLTKCLFIQLVRMKNKRMDKIGLLSGPVIGTLY